MADPLDEQQFDAPAVESLTRSPSFLVLEPPVRLWVPWADPLGTARLKPPGTRVAAGEPLTEDAGGSEYTPLAPMAGRIADTVQATLSNGATVPAVLLETDEAGSALRAENSTPVSSDAIADLLNRLDRANLNPTVELLRRAGVWADRWTSPQLLGQLHACLAVPPDVILCNLLDVDRSLAINRACAREFPAEIVAAIAALARLTGADRAWIAVDADEASAVRAGLGRVAARTASDLRLVPVENHYPQPDATLLLGTLTGRRLRPGRMPTDQKVLLLDGPAAVAVGRALVLGEPMLRVPLALHDRTALTPGADPDAATHLLSVPVGTPLRHVLEHLHIGHAPGRPALEFWSGAPLRELRLTSDCIIAGGELGIFAAPREPSMNPDPCIRCAWCVQGCPVDAHPAALLDAAQRGDAARAASAGLGDCIECGICSYVCPSHLPLLEGIRTLRRR